MNSVHDTDEATANGGEVTFAIQTARVVAKAIDATVVSVAVVMLILAYGLVIQDLPSSDDERGLVLFYVCC